jgi:hypothetical protein
LEPEVGFEIDDLPIRRRIQALQLVLASTSAAAHTRDRFHPVPS